MYRVGGGVERLIGGDKVGKGKSKQKCCGDKAVGADRVVGDWCLWKCWRRYLQFGGGVHATGCCFGIFEEVVTGMMARLEAMFKRAAVQGGRGRVGGVEGKVGANDFRVGDDAEKGGDKDDRVGNNVGWFESEYVETCRRGRGVSWEWTVTGR